MSDDSQFVRLDKETHYKLRMVLLRLLQDKLELQDITIIGLLLDTVGYLIMKKTNGNKRQIDMTLDSMFRILKSNMHRVADKDPKHRLR